jgi:ATP-binding cassette subfamily C protein
MDKNTVVLTREKNFLTKNKYDAYKVIDGTVLVYIVSVNSGKSGRQVPLYEAKPGEVIPAFEYKDSDYNNYAFCLRALEKAEISIMENCSTKILRQRFAEKTGLKEITEENFFEAVAEKYRISTVIDFGTLKRKEKNDETVSRDISSSVFNAFKNKRKNYKVPDTDSPLYNTVSLLCGYSGIKAAEYQKLIFKYSDSFTLDDIAELSGFSFREITIDKDFYKKDIGAFLAFDESDNPIACIPKSNSSYIYFENDSETFKTVTKSLAEKLKPTAVILYRPLPNKKLKFKDILGFCIKCIQPSDFSVFVLLSLICAAIGLSVPIISGTIYDTFIPLGLREDLLSLGFMLASFMAADIILNLIKNLCAFRISSKIAYDFQAAVIHRLINLPHGFFKRNDTASVSIDAIESSALAEIISEEILSSLMCVFLAIVYFSVMVSFSPIMSVFALAAVVLYAIIYYSLSKLLIDKRQIVRLMKLKNSSIIYQFINGVSKIKNAEAEDRAVLKYIRSYIKEENNEEKSNKINGIMTAVSIASSALSTLIFYVIFFNRNLDLSAGAFIAFISLFGGFSLYFTQIIRGAVIIKSLSPNIAGLKRILGQTIEDESDKECLKDFEGNIEVRGLRFSYDNKNILNDINFKITSGSSLGIAGASGCGKSTLLDLILGFEKPDRGSVFYDGVDSEEINKHFLRRKMGVVLQNDSLITGTIYDNLTISNPAASPDLIEKIIKDVGLDEDIKNMPMGLYTMLSESSAAISEGQKQRLLIARALISEPKLIVLDEATSSLDGASQELIQTALKKSPASKIITAQRLSALKDCDKIIVLDSGRIAQTGRFHELMNDKNGLFYKMSVDRL